MFRFLGILSCCSWLAFSSASEVRFLGCYVTRLQPGWVEINSGYRIPERLDLLNLPSRARLFQGHFLPPEGAEIFLDALTPEQSHRPIFSEVKGRRLVKKLTLGIGDPSGLVKENESVIIDLDVYGRTIPDRYVISRITIGSTPVEANLRFRGDDSRQDALVGAFRSTINSLSKLSDRKCESAPKE